MRENIILKEHSFIYSAHVLVNFQKYHNNIIWRKLEIKDNELYLEGQDNCWMPRSNYYYFSKLGDKKLFALEYIYPQFALKVLQLIYNIYHNQLNLKIYMALTLI